MSTGRTIFFDEARGFGFIRPDESGADIHDRHGLKPWTRYQLTDTSLLPSSDAILNAFRDRYPAGVTAADLDPVADGIATMEIQRELAVPDVDRGGGIAFRPGSFVQLTTVTPTEITTRIIHRWPDEIGKRLAPDAA
jgi:hypothetical protein